MRAHVCMRMYDRVTAGCRVVREGVAWRVVCLNAFSDRSVASMAMLREIERERGRERERETPRLLVGLYRPLELLIMLEVDNARRLLGASKRQTHVHTSTCNQ